MRNPLTIEIESRLGIMFVALLATLFIKFMFELSQEFDAEVEVQAATVTNIKVTSMIQKNLIDQWIEVNNIEIPAETSPYRYVQNKYPDKPWFKKAQ